MLRGLRRTADTLRESGSATNFEDITEQDWPDGDFKLHCWRHGASGVDEKHTDSQIEHVEQTPVDAPSQPTVKLEAASFFPALEPVTNPTHLNETAKQLRIGESVPITIANANSVHSTYHKTLLRQFDRLMICGIWATF